MDVLRGCGPGFWNIMYNSLLNLEFTSRTKVIAFADDLILLMRGPCKLEAENYANQDLKQIERWAYKNKKEFNETNLRFCLFQVKDKMTKKSTLIGSQDTASKRKTEILRNIFRHQI